MFRTVDSQRDCHFRSCDHIDRGLPGFEYFEYFPEETIGQQHIGRFDLNRGNPAFGSDGFHIFGRTVFGDQCTFVIGA